MTNKKSKKTEKLKGFSDPPEIKEEKPEEQTKSEDDATYVYEKEIVDYEAPVFVPDDEKIERIKKGLRLERINKDKQLVDYWLRHELQLGTVLIKKMWKKMDEIYRV